MGAAPRLLVTGFGPFPGVDENPTERLVQTLRAEAAGTFGASAFHAAVLPAEYGRAWEALARLADAFAPDVIVHFGVSVRGEAIHVESIGRNRADPRRCDAGGSTPESALLQSDGPEMLPVTLAAQAILTALVESGFAAALSEDAGSYVCNATLYRSLHAAPPERRVGFVHVPPADRLPAPQLRRAALIVLRAATAA